MSHPRGDGPQPSGGQLWCRSPSLGCSSYWKCCVFYSSSLVLQTQQAWPGFSSPGWGSRWFHHAWLTCQLLSSEARPDWFSLPSPLLSLSTSPPLHCLSGWSRSVDVAKAPGWPSQRRMKVCPLTFTSTEPEATQGWGGKGNIECGSGRKKCQAAGRRAAFSQLQH